MDRREFFRLGGAAGIVPLAGLAACGRGPVENPSRPNVLFICTDQFNAACAHFAGHPLVYTPNLDRLARRGAVFANCYSNSPVCVPARASLFTGFYPHEVEAYDNASPFDGRVPTWANRLTASGYLCRATGKLDFRAGGNYGMQETATEHGHDTGPDITAYFRNPLVPRIESRAQIEAFIDERPKPDEKYVAEAVRFLAEDLPGLGKKPWAQYVGLVSPHPSWSISERFYRMYPLDNISLPELPGGWPPHLHPELAGLNHYNMFDLAPFPEGNILRARAAYYGSITMLDEWVGKLMEALEKSGKLDRTLVVFTSDHGEMLGEHGMWFKSCPYEAAARVPLIIAGPGFPAGRVETPVSHVDLVATLLETAGVPPFAGLRGHSLKSLASGAESGAERFAYSELNSEGNLTGVFQVRKAEWKYIHFVGMEPLLFNLKEDPGEFGNLAGREKYREVEKSLKELLFDTVNPEKISVAAFADQRRRLELDLPRLDDPLVYRGYERRLGKEFAEKLKAGKV